MCRLFVLFCRFWCFLAHPCRVGAGAPPAHPRAAPNPAPRDRRSHAGQLPQPSPRRTGVRGGPGSRCACVRRSNSPVPARRPAHLRLHPARKMGIRPRFSWRTSACLRSARNSDRMVFVLAQQATHRGVAVRATPEVAVHAHIHVHRPDVLVRRLASLQVDQHKALEQVFCAAASFAYPSRALGSLTRSGVRSCVQLNS